MFPASGTGLFINHALDRLVFWSRVRLVYSPFARLTMTLVIGTVLIGAFVLSLPLATSSRLLSMYGTLLRLAGPVLSVPSTTFVASAV